eukprot:TRINITY_DN78666_c0_g1_i1.p1 TRINITY_DN78666_c0_g1~~TRINITY_DN78666_c0_g1_i1.p1  ORF type:complete len:559 (+),score=91.73 TRINITY_DN78666_c0_g1_i1:45-1679(+)
MEFGDINMPGSLTGGIVAISSGVAVQFLLACSAPGLMEDGPAKDLVTCVGIPVVCIEVLVLMMNLRGPGLTVPLALCSFLAGYPPTAGSFTNSYTSFALAFMILPVTRARYLRDQRLIVGFMFTTAMSISVGGSFMPCLESGDLNQEAASGLLLIFIIDLAGTLALILATRTNRQLPKALQHCKFCSLGYLRKALQAGLRILRYQDMPPEAFGDVKKSAVLLITSHRWLDQFLCDLPLPEEGCPYGLRLTTMTQSLNGIYPETLCCKSVSAVLESMRLGGNDVLVFFDFMGLPQIGKKDDGELIQRTEEEAAIFFEALPHMGALYTMYPVIVLQEVTPGVSPYESSGWCFSEFCSALLTKQLGKYSAAAVAEYTNNSAFSCIGMILDMAEESTITNQVDKKFIELFDADLSKRKFFNEDDREVVRRIVLGYLVIRQLTDAVRQGAQSEAERLLAHVKELDLLHVLHQAVDDSLDTLLHIAVQSGSKSIAKILIDAGASPEVLNYRGDRPDQWLLLPRCNEAAGFCRQLLAPAGGHDYTAMPGQV